MCDISISTLASAVHHGDSHPLSVEALEGEITTLAASIAVATHRLLHLIAEFDRRAPWGSWGLASCAHWLNWKCGIALGAAREKVRVAHALEELPQINAAFAAGEISYSKVRAMSRVATPQNESYLLHIARCGTAAHVERLVRGYRRARRLEAACNAYAERCLDLRHEEDGSVILRARLPAEQGALVMKALQAAVAELRREREGRDRTASGARDVSAETSGVAHGALAAGFDPATEPHAAARADALCHLAEQFLANESVPARQAERYQVVVHVQQHADADEPDQDGAHQQASCRLEHDTELAEETARRIACDAAVVTVQEDTHGNVLDIGRRTRSIPPAIRRALQRRDGGCRFPGCLNHRFVDAHHVHHWADGGETRMGNLVLLCRHHHRLLHEFGFRIERRDDGQLLFFRPDGQLIPAVAPPPAVVPLIAGVVAICGVDVSAETRMPCWDGGHMDLDDAVQLLFARTDGSCKGAVMASR
jgi:hypothetical protein